MIRDQVINASTATSETRLEGPLEAG